jgi:hypothetical protein
VAVETIKLRLTANARNALVALLPHLGFEGIVTVLEYTGFGVDPKEHRYETSEQMRKSVRLPRWGVAFVKAEQIPRDFVQEIDGIRFTFDQGPISAQLNGKILDHIDGCFSIRSDSEGI